MVEKRMPMSLALKAIKTCTGKKTLEATFNRHKILEPENRIKLLLKAMGNPAFSYSCGYPEPQERYKIISDAYLSGIWRKDYYSLKNKRKVKTAILEA
jgi:hypothetical protein